MTIQPTTRREFHRMPTAAVLGGTLALGCSRHDPETIYDALVASTWRHSDDSFPLGPVLLREVVRYATLAANSHNTQPWRFRIESDRITVLPDFSRRCPVVDPDDHHLFVSLGCATENLVLASEAFGLRARVSTRSDDDSIRVDLEPGVASESPLFRAIPERQCTRAEYDGKPVAPDKLAALEATARGEGVDVQIFTDKRDLEEILEYVMASMGPNCLGPYDGR